MGREKLPCGHTALDEGIAIILEDAAYCTHHKKRYKWRPATWIEIKPKVKSSPTSTAATTI